MNEQKKLVPKLRFPEFRGEWESKNLGSVARLRNGYAFKSAEYVDDGPYQIITIANVQQGNLLIESTKRMAALPPDIQQHQVLNLGDILISMTGNVGRVCQVTYESLLLNQRVGKLVPINIDAAFFYQLLQCDEFRNSMQLKAAGGAQGNLSAGDITEYAFSVPAEPSKQQKIADCLSSLDELIAAQARKVEALKTHKKGLMQQLFPREGETQPRLRFPEFLNAGDWEMKSLGSFSKVGDIDHKMPSSTADGVPYMMTGDFFGMNDIDYENAKKISIEDYEQLSKKIKPELGDIVIARYASVGAVRYIQTKLKFLVSYSCAIIKCIKSEDSRYIYYAFQSDVIQSQIRLEINTSSQKNIGIDSIKKIKFFLPILSEQLKISDCFAVLDNQITAATLELDTLKIHKKGLMQQLFPSAEALAL
jgi:type I restriction enzyme S subunit